MRSQSLFRLLLRKQNLIRRERGCALSLILVLFFYNCGPLAPEDWAPSMSLVLLVFGGGTTSPTPLKPGQIVNLNGGQGDATGIVVDVDGDGFADGISLGPANSGPTPSKTRPILILIHSQEAGHPGGLDVNGDGNVDYYISYGNGENITLTSRPNGGGDRVTVVPGQGFDSNEDGAIDNPILRQLAGDTTFPVSTITPAGGTYTSSQNLTILCSDNIAPGHIVYTKNGTAPSYKPMSGAIKNPPSTSFTVGAEGNGTYVVKYLCRDLAGNSETTHTDTYIIDNNVPNITASLASVYVSNNGGAINSSLLTWSSDVNGNYSIRTGSTNCTDGTELSNGSILSATPDTSTTFTAGSLALGNTSIRICVTNTSNGLVGSYGLTITRDDTAPTVTASPTSGSYITLISVSLTCNDAGGAGCDQIAFSSATGTEPTDPVITGTTGTITSGNLYSTSIATTDLTTTYVKFIACDQAGNISTVGSENYVVETTPSTPTQVSALGVGTEIFVQWAPVPNVSDYRVYYSTTNPVTTSSTSITGITNLYHKLTGLTGNTTHYIRVEARNSMGVASQLSGEQTVFTTSTPPGTAGSGTHVDISAGQGTSSGFTPTAAIDPSSNKLLVVTSNGWNNNKLSLFRCNLDGSSCTHTDISTGQGTSSGLEATLVIDSTSNKLLIVTKNGANNNKPSLFRCNLDGSSCTHNDISAGQGTNSGQTPHALIDSLSNKLLVLTTNGANNSKPSLFRCNLDGSNCTHNDISAGQGTNSGDKPSGVVDPGSNKLLVITSNGANSFKPSLFRCNLDGSSCTHTDISVGQGFGSGASPANLLIDQVSSKLLLVTNNNANDSKPSLFRCDLDGSNCTHTDISAGQGITSGLLPSSLIDSISNKLLVVTYTSTPSLFRCNLDGSNCIHTDISMGQGTDSGIFPTALIDPVSGKLLVVTENDANNFKPSLFVW